MKKRLIGLALLCITLMTRSMAYGYIVDDPSMIHALEDGQTYVNGEIREDIKDVQYVGNGYLFTQIKADGQDQRCFTTDFTSVKEVVVYQDTNLDPHSRAGHMDEIIWADGIYLARADVFDEPERSGRVLEEKGYLYILNTDFQLEQRIEFDWYVREMSYVEGVYYIRINNESFLRANRWSSTKEDIVDKVYASPNLSTWEERLDLKHVPLTNGLASLTMKDYNIYTFENGQIEKRIVYEEVETERRSNVVRGAEKELNLVGEYFYIGDNSMDAYYSWFSKDGVYFTKYKLNTTLFKNGVDGLVDKFGEGYLKKSDIDYYLHTSDTYVQVNDEILGFETPPVTEADRTLVPMRFLFEKLGAEVSWDEATNTATAAIPANVTDQIQTFGMAEDRRVSFSIDDTTASVNGAVATMDVPARLVNDKTMVPLRFLSENLGYTVTWDEATNTAIVE